MTAPSGSYVRLTAGGDIATVQSWSTGLAVSAPGSAVTQDNLQALLVAFRTAWEAQWSSATTGQALRGINASDTRLFRYRAYLYPPSGGPAILQASEDRTPIAGNGSSVMPVQTALVATLLSGLPGRSYRGRMYLPATALALQGSHQINQTACTALATSVAAIVTAVNTATTGTPFGEVVIAGLRGRIPVSSVRVDSEPDIQRRRADKILPSFFGTANV